MLTGGLKTVNYFNIKSHHKYFTRSQINLCYLLKGDKDAKNYGKGWKYRYF